MHLYYFPADFVSLTGTHWPMLGKSLSEIMAYLESISGVYSISAEHGYPLWFVNSALSEHLKQLILNQNLDYKSSPSLAPSSATNQTQWNNVNFITSQFDCLCLNLRKN